LWLTFGLVIDGQAFVSVEMSVTPEDARVGAVAPGQSSGQRWRGSGATLVPGDISHKMRAFTEAREDWLTAVRLPGYAPDLNAVEGAWAVMKSGLGNHAAATLGHLESLVRIQLRAIQRLARPHQRLLGQTGLTLDPPP
jgi:hypothetical protein